MKQSRWGHSGYEQTGDAQGADAIRPQGKDLKSSREEGPRKSDRPKMQCHMDDYSPPRSSRSLESSSRTSGSPRHSTPDTGDLQETSKKSRSRRPDAAVYVPRGRRTQEPSGEQEVSPEQHTQPSKPEEPSKPARRPRRTRGVYVPRITRDEHAKQDAKLQSMETAEVDKKISGRTKTPDDWPENHEISGDKVRTSSDRQRNIGAANSDISMSVTDMEQDGIAPTGDYYMDQSGYYYNQHDYSDPYADAYGYEYDDYNQGHVDSQCYQDYGYPESTGDAQASLDSWSTISDGSHPQTSVHPSRSPEYWNTDPRPDDKDFSHEPTQPEASHKKKRHKSDKSDKSDYHKSDKRTGSKDRSGQGDEERSHRHHKEHKKKKKHKDKDKEPKDTGRRDKSLDRQKTDDTDMLVDDKADNGAGENTDDIPHDEKHRRHHKKKKKHHREIDERDAALLEVNKHDKDKEKHTRRRKSHDKKSKNEKTSVQAPEDLAQVIDNDAQEIQTETKEEQKEEDLEDVPDTWDQPMDFALSQDGENMQSKPQKADSGAAEQTGDRCNIDAQNDDIHSPKEPMDVVLDTDDQSCVINAGCSAELMQDALVQQSISAHSERGGSGEPLLVQANKARQPPVGGNDPPVNRTQSPSMVLKACDHLAELDQISCTSNTKSSACDDAYNLPTTNISSGETQNVETADFSQIKPAAKKLLDESVAETSSAEPSAGEKTCNSVVTPSQNEDISSADIKEGESQEVVLTSKDRTNADINEIQDTAIRLETSSESENQNEKLESKPLRDDSGITDVMQPNVDDIKTEHIAESEVCQLASQTVLSDVTDSKVVPISDMIKPKPDTEDKNTVESITTEDTTCLKQDEDPESKSISNHKIEQADEACEASSDSRQVAHSVQQVSVSVQQCSDLTSKSAEACKTSKSTEVSESQPTEEDSKPVVVSQNSGEQTSQSADRCGLISKPADQTTVVSTPATEPMDNDLPMPEASTSSQPVDGVKAEDAEEDSWDQMFDDDGEALDPQVVQELTAAVGAVEIQKPKFDYLAFKSKDPELDYDAYNHLIEIYDFSSELITRDLLAVFRDYMERGFDLKWVDDTHCIGVFSSSFAAQAALSMVHPLLKVRPISQASRQTKLKAKRCTEFLQPYKPRPETTASVARNLVAGALGLRSAIPREQRAEERRKLKEAKDKKKQANRQKTQAWEGVFGRCAMDEV